MWQDVRSNSPAETRQAGARLAAELDPEAVVALHGGLGSGKTTFVQGLAAGLGLEDEVTSPTFALIHEYGRPARLFHLDCYREPSIDRWIGLGVSEYFAAGAIAVVEWPDTIAGLLPPETLHLHFDLGPTPAERLIREQP